MLDSQSTVIAAFILVPRRLLFVFILGFLTTLLRGFSLLSPYAPRASTTKWRSKSKVDMFLGIEAYDERGDIDDLFADTKLPI
jgi:hypothetical protein